MISSIKIEPYLRGRAAAVPQPTVRSHWTRVDHFGALASPRLQGPLHLQRVRNVCTSVLGKDCTLAIADLGTRILPQAATSNIQSGTSKARPPWTLPSFSGPLPRPALRGAHAPALSGHAMDARHSRFDRDCSSFVYIPFRIKEHVA